MESSDYLIEKKIEYIIDMKIKKIMAELSAAGDIIKQMSGEMDVLKNQVQRLNMAPAPVVQPQVAVAPVHVEAAPQTVQIQPQLQVASQRNSQAGYNQRVGDLKPGDIDINNMFYFGNKR